VTAATIVVVSVIVGLICAVIVLSVWIKCLREENTQLKSMLWNSTAPLLPIQWDEPVSR